MTDIRFVRTHHHYVPYDDWFKLAALSGFTECFPEEIEYDNPAHCYIVHHFAGLYLDKNRTPTATFILWQTEYIEAQGYHEYPPYLIRWHMDKWQAEETGSRYVPVGSHPGLVETDETLPTPYDVALMAYLPPRRTTIVELLNGAVTVAPNAWGKERSVILNSCRLMLHIHQRDYAYYVPGIRLALAAAHKLPLICEDVYEKGILGDEVMFEPYIGLAKATQLWLRPIAEASLRGYAERLHQALCVDRTFERVVRENV